MRQILDNELGTIKESKGVKVIDFWAAWCGPCKMYSPIFEKVEQDFPEVEFGKVNVDDNPKISTFFGIRSIPTTIIMKDGEIADIVYGIMSKNDLGLRVKRAKG